MRSQLLHSVIFSPEGGRVTTRDGDRGPRNRHAPIDDPCVTSIMIQLFPIIGFTQLYSIEAVRPSYQPKM